MCAVVLVAYTDHVYSRCALPPSLVPYATSCVLPPPACSRLRPRAFASFWVCAFRVFWVCTFPISPLGACPLLSLFFRWRTSPSAPLAPPSPPGLSCLRRHIEIAHVGEELACGNTEGIYVLERLEEHSEQIKELTTTNERQPATMARLDAAFQQSQKEIASLKQSS